MLDRKHAQKKRQKSASHLCSFEPPDAQLSAQAVSSEQLAALASEDGQLFVVNLNYYRHGLGQPQQVIKPHGSID